MRIIFDNNIWISFLIGKRLSSLRSVFVRDDVEVYYCDELEQEFLDVAHRPKIQKYVSEEQVERVHRLMKEYCHKATASANLMPNAVRDPKDVYLLALSDAIHADYLISGDADLTDMQKHNQTTIVDFNTAIGILAQ